VKYYGYLAALASLVAASSANAQAASSAFECELPYEQSMMALGSLTVLDQSTVAAFPGLHGEGHLIEFAPAGTVIYGAEPEKLALKVLPPHPWQQKGKYVIAFFSTFAKSAAADEAIKQSVTWNSICSELEFCIRSEAAKTDGSGRLEYRRGADLELKCVFEFTPEEFDALGS
tara:strand:+ start:1560 stop:2078 length:519 start_codon:yes stop_codon:yes gene_type:complete